MEVIRWAVALTIYPFLWIGDLIDGHQAEEERFIREQREMFLRQHEGE